MLIWNESAIGGDHDELKFRAAQRGRSGTPAEMHEFIFFEEIEVAGCWLWGDFWSIGGGLVIFSYETPYRLFPVYI